MDGETNDQIECDELEMLLGEIPNATYGKPPSMSLENLGSIYVNHPLGIFVETNGGTGTFDPRNNIVDNKSPYLPSKNPCADLEEPNLPDDQSLTSALADLSFRTGLTLKTGFTDSNMAEDKSAPGHPILSNGQFPGSSLKKPISSMDSNVTLVSSSHTSDDSPNCYDVLKVKSADQPSSNVFELKVEALKRCNVDCCQPIKTFSGSLPSSQQTNCSYLSPNAPTPVTDFSTMPAQHRYFVDPQSPLYLRSERCMQPEITWRHMDQDRYDRMQQYYLYLQQLQNQRLEACCAVQAGGSVTSGLVSWNLTQPFSDMSFSQNPFEQPHQISYWNKAAISRSSNQPHRVSPSTYFGRKQIADKAGKQTFPEKILTRSQGVNSLRSIKLSPSGVYETPAYVNQHGRAFPNGHIRGLSNLASGCLQIGSLNMQCSTLDGLDVKHDNLSQKYSSLEELAGRIHLIAKDQHGCRFLQRRFVEGSQEDVAMIFNGIISHVVDLMTDPFGNYLVQKLLEVCDDDQRMQILIAISKKAGELVRISCDMHGTRAVQKVVETLKTPEESSIIVSSLKPGIVDLIKNMNGNHVAQRCLQYLMPEFKEFLFEAATLNCVDLATDRHGCCVLQKCLSYSDGEQRRCLIHEITSNALILSQDPFGNYVVQFVLELGIPWATVDVLTQLENNYSDMSVQKYSSNVVEKCLKYAGEESRCHIIKELISSGRLDQIMQDPYGNYVVQAALNHSKGATHAALVDAIRPHIPVLRTSPYGKKVLSRNCLKK